MSAPKVKCRKRKAVNYAENDETDMVDDDEMEPCTSRKRLPKYTQDDTNLLLKLVNESTVNSMQTNLLTTHGRHLQWAEIAKQYNAIAAVVKDLYFSLIGA